MTKQWKAIRCVYTKVIRKMWRNFFNWTWDAMRVVLVSNTIQEWKESCIIRFLHKLHRLTLEFEGSNRKCRPLSKCASSIIKPIFDHRRTSFAKFANKVHWMVVTRRPRGQQYRQQGECAVRLKYARRGQAFLTSIRLVMQCVFNMSAPWHNKWNDIIPLRMT